MSHLLFFRTGCCTYIVNAGIIFCRGVYLAENTSQAASVEFVRLKQNGDPIKRGCALWGEEKFRHGRSILLKKTEHRA